MLTTLEETIKLIKEGKILHIAGHDSLLSQLPTGQWIGGTTPYFMSNEGTIMTKEKLFVNEIDFAENIKIAVYGKYNVFQIVEDCYDNGLNMMIMPYGSEVTTKYAKEAPDVEELLLHPTVGWISGNDLDENVMPMVYDGTTGRSYTDKAVVMFIELAEGKTANINIVNIFEDDKTDPVIKFPDNTLDVTNCKVNGHEVNLSEYIGNKGINTQMPLVADCNGVYINTSIKSVENGKVSLYAPVFRGYEYRFAKPVSNYEVKFKEKINSTGATHPFFACNCILNYMYGGLEGMAIPPYLGPITFGEIAYQLMNQTLVYCEIE